MREAQPEIPAPSTPSKWRFSLRGVFYTFFGFATLFGLLGQLTAEEPHRTIGIGIVVLCYVAWVVHLIRGWQPGDARNTSTKRQRENGGLGGAHGARPSLTPPTR